MCIYIYIFFFFKKSSSLPLTLDLAHLSPFPNDYHALGTEEEYLKERHILGPNIWLNDCFDLKSVCKGKKEEHLSSKEHLANPLLCFTDNQKTQTSISHRYKFSYLTRSRAPLMSKQCKSKSE
jgi:hypothetical protein